MDRKVGVTLEKERRPTNIRSRRRGVMLNASLRIGRVDRVLSAKRGETGRWDVCLSDCEGPGVASLPLNYCVRTYCSLESVYWLVGI